MGWVGGEWQKGVGTLLVRGKEAPGVGVWEWVRGEVWDKGYREEWERGEGESKFAYMPKMYRRIHRPPRRTHALGLREYSMWESSAEW